MHFLAKGEVPKVCVGVGEGKGVGEVTLFSFRTCSFDLWENFCAENRPGHVLKRTGSHSFHRRFNSNLRGPVNSCQWLFSNMGKPILMSLPKSYSDIFILL